MEYGYGFKYFYKKKITKHIKYQNKDFGEDFSFIECCKLYKIPIKSITDENGLCIHLMHYTNTSIVFPKHILSENVMKTKFPDFTIKNT